MKEANINQKVVEFELFASTSNSQSSVLRRGFEKVTFEIHHDNASRRSAWSIREFYARNQINVELEIDVERTSFQHH